MAVDPEIEKLRSILVTKEDVGRFFDAKKVNLTCELCGESDWAINTEYAVSYLPTILVTCRNCGNMRLHSHIPVQIWKRDGEPNGGR